MKQLASEYSASRSEKLVELTDSLSFLEIFLINKDYVAGDTLTIADISLLANVTNLEIAVEFDLSAYSNIWGWFNRLRRELPYYDELTKVAHAEHRELIRNIRNAHEEWSAAHFCAFCPCEKHDGQTYGDQAQNGQIYNSDHTHNGQDYNNEQAQIGQTYNMNPLIGQTYDEIQLQNGNTYNGQPLNRNSYNEQDYSDQVYNGQIYNGN